jgi:hypothetical protein
MVDFATAVSQNGVSITQQTYHFTNCSKIKDESNKNSNVFCHFILNNKSFVMKGKLVNTKFFL